MKTADGSGCYVLDLDLTTGSLVKLASLWMQACSDFERSQRRDASFCLSMIFQRKEQGRVIFRQHLLPQPNCTFAKNNKAYYLRRKTNE